MRSFAVAFLFALTASAVPTPADLEERQSRPFQVTDQQPWNAGATTEFQIHSSCNGSQTYQLRHGLNEAVQLAQHAKDHINRWGNSSTIYRKYFGNAPTLEAIGAYDSIVNGNKAQTLFRCDDPDGNCAAFPTWAGHWRGTNATHETVICPPSFIQRRPLANLCLQGYTVRESSRVVYWASDLLHRMFHVPEFGQGYVEHFADGWDGIVAAAARNSPDATHDSDGLQYFALEAYAFDVVAPGVGCPGSSSPPKEVSSSAAVPASTSTVSSAAAASTPPATTTAAAAASATDIPANCHTHADGALHCT